MECGSISTASGFDIFISSPRTRGLDHLGCLVHQVPPDVTIQHTTIWIIGVRISTSQSVHMFFIEDMEKHGISQSKCSPPRHVNFHLCSSDGIVDHDSNERLSPDQRGESNQNSDMGLSRNCFYTNSQIGKWTVAKS